MKHFFLFFVAAFIGMTALVAGKPAGAGPTAEAGAYRVSVTTDPAVVPAQGKVTLKIRITDRSGKPASGVSVRALTKMPGMDMGEREAAAVPAGDAPGEYVAPATFAMEGGYESTLAISGPLGSATARLPLRTGENTRQAPRTAFSVPLLFGVVAGALLVAFVLWRLRRMGRLPHARQIINRQTVGGLLLLAVATAASVYGVKNLRRPGALTPVDAQAMDMSYMPPPPGFAPVELATVSRGSVESWVRYAATAVGFAEQPVYSRITGTLLFMPFYAGDRVRKGQLLARLDTSQARPQQAEREAAVTQAAQGVGVARAEQQQAEAGIAVARAELGGKRGAIAEAQNNVQAARDAQASAGAALEAARAQITDAQAQEEAAQADATFWKAQIARSEQLLNAGAVSGEEFQRDRAQAERAAAKVRQFHAQIARTRSDARAQEAAVRQATSQIAAAAARVRMAQAELAAYRSRVQAMQAARDVARQKIGQAQTGVTQARAALSAATANQGYAEIRSPFDGVVTARQIAPGTLVNPGQAILMLAQIDPVRVQASVAQTDLPSLRVGAPVRLLGQEGMGAKPIPARVTSVAPAVDASARTGIAEAVVSNPAQKILPGQYLTMEIATGARRAAVRVPRQALVYRPVSSSVASDLTAPLVWVAEPGGQAGQFTVRAVPVRTGTQGSDMVEVVSGLSEGQRVVVSGTTYLKDGDTVADISPSATPGGTAMGPDKPASQSKISVSVTERGFEPSSLPLKAGVPVQVTFTRTTDATCAKEVLFPDYGINKALPLNRPVVVSFTPRKGTFTFACGMNMVKGQVIAQ